MLAHMALGLHSRAAIAGGLLALLLCSFFLLHLRKRVEGTHVLHVSNPRSRINQNPRPDTQLQACAYAVKRIPSNTSFPPFSPSKKEREETQHTSPILPRRAPGEVLKQHIAHIDATRVLGARRGVDVKIAGVEHDRPVGVVVVEVEVGDVLDIAVADVGAGPAFEACAVLCVGKG